MIISQLFAKMFCVVCSTKQKILPKIPGFSYWPWAISICLFYFVFSLDSEGHFCWHGVLPYACMVKSSMPTHVACCTRAVVHRGCTRERWSLARKFTEDLEANTYLTICWECHTPWCIDQLLQTFRQPVATISYSPSVPVQIKFCPSI